MKYWQSGWPSDPRAEDIESEERECDAMGSGTEARWKELKRETSVTVR
jgi:hypothetical protein